MSKPFSIALVGNPNCGKTTLFNVLTGARQRVGNWPGVTVERKSGTFEHGGQSYEVVDLPGTYSLHVGADDTSLDEQIAQQFIFSGTADVVLNIVDASALERNLYLTTQLLDASVPLVVALNMTDVAHQNGIHIDPFSLSQQLGCPVVPIVASRSEGMGMLLDVLENQRARPVCPVRPFQYPPALEQAIAELSVSLTSHADSNRHLLAVGALEQDAGALAVLEPAQREQLTRQQNELSAALGEPLEQALVNSRYRWVDAVVQNSVTLDTLPRRNWSQWVDAIVLNRILGIPLFLMVMYLMFLLSVNVGDAFIDVFEGTAGALFVDGPRALLEAINTPEWLIVLLANGLGGGIQLVASFIPVIAGLFLCLSFLEDSGYMARAAFIVDRVMRAVGLPGKAFVPLIVGFGCNVPSVMATRTLENHNDRLIAAMMAPFMSCSARLAVFALFAAAFFPRNGQNVVFGLYIIGIVLAILTAFLMRRFMMAGPVSPFIMELPAYHLPNLRNLLILTWQRLRGFMLRAGKAIVLVAFILNILSAIGTDGSFGHENSDQSVIAAIGRTITPIFEPMGIREDNWPATVGVFTGLFAKEVVVGTLDALYSQPETSDDGPYDFWGAIGDALATVPANVMDLSQRLWDPLGMSIMEDDVEELAESQSVRVTTIGMLVQHFDGAAGAFAYLLFVLLYAPCVATMGAIYKENGGYWTGFSLGWSLLLGYAVAVMFYQLANFAAHPLASVLWSAGMVLMLVAGFAVLVAQGRRIERQRREKLIALVNI